MKTLPAVFLSDDGTLDTVFRCGACKTTLRYAADAFERSEDGSLADEDATLASVQDEHDCKDCIDHEYYSKWEE